jgi:hypothetical protein
MKAHGQYFATKADADARIAEINEENLKYGASDGRVTEIATILQMMELYGWEKTPAQAFMEKHQTFTEGKKFVTAKERGIKVGSKIVGVFNSWANEIPFAATVTGVYAAAVVFHYDEPFTAEGPWVGDFRGYTGGGAAPGQLRLASEIW